MTMRSVRAAVISCPGRLGDTEYSALQIDVEGFSGPYILTLVMPAIGFRALTEQADPGELYDALARAINVAEVKVDVRAPKEPKPKATAVAA